MAAATQSGELFTGQLAAFMPRRVAILGIEDAAPSERDCEWHPAGHACVSKQTFWFRVNHLLLSLCRLHAKMLARQKRMQVTVDTGAMAAISGH